MQVLQLVFCSTCLALVSSLAATEISTEAVELLEQTTIDSQQLDESSSVRSKRMNGDLKSKGEKEARSFFGFGDDEDEAQRKRRSGSDFLNLFASKLKPKGGLLSVSNPDRQYPGPISPEWQEPLHYGQKSFNLWGFKKAIFGAIVQAVKAITGGVLALKGQLLKVKGHIVEAKGKVLQTKGEAISEFGKQVATKALLNPPATHYSASSSASGPGISSPAVHFVRTVTYPKTRQTSCLKRIKIPEWDGGTGVRKIKVVKINKCAIRSDKWPPGETAHISFPPGGPSGYAAGPSISAAAPVYGPPIPSSGSPSFVGRPHSPLLPPPPPPLPPKVIPALLGPRPPLPVKGLSSVYGPPSHSQGLGPLPPSGGGSYGPPPGHFGGPSQPAPSPFLSSYDRPVPQGPPINQGYGPPSPGNEYLPPAGFGKPIQEYGQPYKRDSNAYRRVRQDLRKKKEISVDQTKKDIDGGSTQKYEKLN